MRGVLLMGIAAMLLAGETEENREITEAEQKWLTAMRTGDADLMSSLVAPDFSGTTTVGRTYSSREWALQFSSEWSRPFRDVSVGNRNIRMHTGFAVVTGYLQYPKNRVAYTHVWEKAKDGWRLVALHETAMALPARK